jgi:hypothetical protein
MQNPIIKKIHLERLEIAFAAGTRRAEGLCLQEQLNVVKALCYKPEDRGFNTR